jgi:hypothetical protein
MTEWNPNKTATLGLEFMPVFGGLVNIDAPSKMIGTSWDQSVSQIVGTVAVPNTGISVRGGVYVVEAYDNETAVGDLAAVGVDAVPNEDVTDGTWKNEAGNNTNIFDSINEGNPGTTANYASVSGTASQLVQRFNTGSLTLTGKRIVGLRLGIRYALGSTSVLSAGLNLSGVDYPLLQNLSGPRSDSWIYAYSYYNPSTKKPWTIADVQALDTTDEFWLTGQSKAGVWSAVVVYDVTLTVYTVAETRLAFATLDDSASALAVGNNTLPAWNATGNMTTPTGGAWTKDGTGRHLFTVRRLSPTGSMSIPFVDTMSPVAGVGTPFSLFNSWMPTLDSQWSFPTAMGSALSRLHAFVLRTTVPADSVDSLPYVKLQTALVYTGRNAEQEFSNAAVAAYGILRFWAYMRAGQTANLDVKIKRRSDNVQFGTTYSLTPALWATTSQKVPGADPTFGWGLVQVQIPASATLAAATQYYIEFSSAAAVATSWGVLALDSPGSTGSVATFGGTTDEPTYNGVVDVPTADLLVTLSTIPVAPASMTAALGTQAVGETVNCVTAIPRADLSWATTSLAGSFTRYEIQRSEDAGATWMDIAWVTVESVAAWKDYEAKRGIAATYRIRVVRSDGAVSPYTAAGASVTKPLLAGTGAYATTMYLVTNYNPTQNLAYEYRPGKNYDFNEADEQTRQGAYGRDYQLAANPLENRGVTAHWTLIVGADDKLPTGGGLGWNAYTPLRNLARAVIPYICVLDHRGNRMLAALRVPTGNEDSSGGADLYLADVQGDEVAATPFVVAVAA